MPIYWLDKNIFSRHTNIRGKLKVKLTGTTTKTSLVRKPVGTVADVI